MIRRINKNLIHEVDVLEEIDRPELIEHFANKMMEIALEVSNFGSGGGENLMDINEIQSKFYKLNLCLKSRYQSVLDKMKGTEKMKGPDTSF